MRNEEGLDNSDDDSSKYKLLYLAPQIYDILRR